MIPLSALDEDIVFGIPPAALDFLTLSPLPIAFRNDDIMRTFGWFALLIVCPPASLEFIHPPSPLLPPVPRHRLHPSAFTDADPDPVLLPLLQHLRRRRLRRRRRRRRRRRLRQVLDEIRHWRSDAAE